MKKFLILAAVSFFFTGCATYVTVTNDPYTNEIVVKYEKRFRVIEGHLSNGRTCFMRTIKKGVKSPVTIEVEIDGITGARTGYHGEDLDEAAYVLVDNTSYPVRLTGRTKDKEMFLHGRASGEGKMRMGTGGRIMDVDSTIMGAMGAHCFLKAKIVATPEMEKALGNAKKLSMRFSTGGKHLVLKAEKDQLEMIRELVAFTPGQK